MNTHTLTPQQIKDICEKSTKCDRIELVPTKDGFKIFYITRKTE